MVGVGLGLEVGVGGRGVGVRVEVGEAGGWVGEGVIVAVWVGGGVGDGGCQARVTALQASEASKSRTKGRSQTRSLNLNGQKRLEGINNLRLSRTWDPWEFFQMDPKRKPNPPRLPS